MRQQYFNIKIPKNPLDLILDLNLKVYSLLDNGHSNYIVGYCNNQDKTFNLKTEKDYYKLVSQKEYLFGFIPYDQKNIFLKKSSINNESIHNFSQSRFFIADGVFIFKNEINIFYGTQQEYDNVIRKLNQKIKRQPINQINNKPIKPLTHKTTEQEYISNVNRIKDHIQKGDIYEVNYCINFENKNVKLSSIDTYQRLKERTGAPFSANFQMNEVCILSASPERFINKSNNTLLSQPIKGTAKRGRNQLEDKKLIEKLKNDPKEISENIMIVDLVRNDLSKISNDSSVKVTELCQIYTFKTVHQLVSTVQSKITKTITIIDILKALFPMGSMTGAPKLSAVNIIEKYENFKREVYSGSVGFISPNNSFDFNVIIRSIVHNMELNTLSISVGSAITIKSNPRSEYKECLLKLEAIQSVL